jgi:hypothetical protein
MSALVIDANIMRAVLGMRTRNIMAKFGPRVDFAAPAIVFVEVRRNLPKVLESMARQRLARRDEDDWPVLATALALGCPIWTEDKDFFGCGVATRTTDWVELYLAAADPSSATMAHGA